MVSSKKHERMSLSDIERKMAQLAKHTDDNHPSTEGSYKGFIKIVHEGHKDIMEHERNLNKITS